MLTQISSVTRALPEVAQGLLDEHPAYFACDAVGSGGSEADAKVAEASEAITRLIRS
jgi:DNA-binding FrmR family transcriptional regulator